ncbi:MAG: YkgJ family cysteine cluster protein [Myxococcales bacterium]|nr:YkgJ family cysteine cluster protein [Myxococcales bacterium]
MQTLPGARWSCHGCGACCRDFRLGPVEPGVVEDLKARGAGQLAGREDWAVPEPGPNGEVGWFLRHVDGHCVFLLPDNRCAVHATYGAEAKPGFCREFPFRRLRDPNGEVLVIRAECGGFHASHTNGAELAAQTEEAASLPSLWPTPEFKPAAVAVMPGVGLTLADWMALEGALLRCWEGVDPDQAEPEDTARALARSAVHAVGKTLGPGRAELAAGAVREAMRMVTQAAMAQETDATEDWQKGLVREVAALLQTAHSPRPFAPATRRYLHTLLGQAILGKHLLAAGGFVPMLGRFVFECALVRTAAVQPGERGEAAGASISPTEASAVLVPWLRFADNPMVLAMLRRTTPALMELAGTPLKDSVSVPTIRP